MSRILQRHSCGPSRYDPTSCPLPFRPVQGFQNALQIIQLLPALGQLPVEYGVRRLCLGVALIVFRRVLLRGEQRVQGHGQLPALWVIVVDRRQ